MALSSKSTGGFSEAQETQEIRQALVIASRLARALPHLVLSLIIAISCLASDAYAQGIRVIDCQGNTRALRKGPSENSIKVEVVDSQGKPADNVQFQIKNAVGDILKAIARKGIVEFPEVESGVWMLTSESPSIFFTSISLSDPIAVPFWEQTQEFLMQAGKIALITGAIVGAAVLIDEASDGNGSNSDDSVSPPSDNCPACDPDASAPSIPSFD